MKTATLIGLVVMSLVIMIAAGWIWMTRHRLLLMIEHIQRATSQVELHLSSRMEVLTALAKLVGDYTTSESQALLRILDASRRPITEGSEPEDVKQMEHTSFEVLVRIVAVAEQYPALKADRNYRAGRNAVDQYDHMVQASRLIYNDSVSKFNREIRTVPTSLIAGMLGFRERRYLEAEETKNIFR